MEFVSSVKLRETVPAFLYRPSPHQHTHTYAHTLSGCTGWFWNTCVKHTIHFWQLTMSLSARTGLLGPGFQIRLVDLSPFRSCRPGLRAFIVAVQAHVSLLCTASCLCEWPGALPSSLLGRSAAIHRDLPGACAAALVLCRAPGCGDHVRPRHRCHAGTFWPSAGW